jgi:hypothetical protein
VHLVEGAEILESTSVLFFQPLAASQLESSSPLSELHYDYLRWAQRVMPHVERSRRKGGLPRGHACEGNVLYQSELLIPHRVLNPVILKLKIKKKGGGLQI